MYDDIKAAFGHVEGQHFPIYKKVAAGMTCGALASAIFTPVDVVKVRMQADAAGTRYKGMLDAFRTIAKEEGVQGLYTGMSPTVQRAAIVAASELASYDVFKSELMARQWEDGVAAHIVASLGAGFVATVASSPADVVKSRVMSQVRHTHLVTMTLSPHF